jgi:hypothetical protein
MTQIARILSVALLALAVLAGSASAECAWVLWYEEGLIQFPQDQPLSTSMSWKLVRASVTAAECKLALAAEIIKRSSPRDPNRWGIMVFNDSVSEDLFDVTDGQKGRLLSTTLFKYICLPDTIDPRGPKGK